MKNEKGLTGYLKGLMQDAQMVRLFFIMVAAVAGTTGKM